jgi:hypothetical protein
MHCVTARSERAQHVPYTEWCNGVPGSAHPPQVGRDITFVIRMSHQRVIHQNRWISLWMSANRPDSTRSWWRAAICGTPYAGPMVQCRAPTEPRTVRPSTRRSAASFGVFARLDFWVALVTPKPRLSDGRRRPGSAYGTRRPGEGLRRRCQRIHPDTYSRAGPGRRSTLRAVRIQPLS